MRCMTIGGLLRTETILALGAWFAAACGPTGYDGNDNGNGNAPQADAAVPGPDGGGSLDAQVGRDAAPGSDAGEICGAQTEPIEIINLGDPPDMLIVLDRSGSMMLPPGLIPVGTSKWVLMKNALQALLDAKQHNIRFGMTVFPTNDDCGVDPGARVPIALSNGGAIMSYLNSISYGGNTPATYALAEALTYYQSLPENPAGRYVLFATDGAPNYGGDPPNVDITTDAETIQAVADLAAAGIHSFVLGFGSGLPSSTLNDAAQAGLEPRPNGPPHFYQAEDETSLNNALMAIAGGIIVPSCSFALASLPPVPDDVAVYFDGVPVPRNPGHVNGWDYHPDAGTITFFGSYCDDLTSGQVASVEFLFGCPGPVVY